MKTCSKCNIQYPDNKRFCKKCGELLKPDRHIGNMQPKAEYKAVENIDSDKTSSSKRQVIKFVLIGASVIIIVVIVVFVFLYLKQKSAWAGAMEKNTFTSYQEYIDEYPNGKYVDEAHKKIKDKNDSIFAIAIADSIAAAEQLQNENRNNINTINPNEFIVIANAGLILRDGPGQSFNKVVTIPLGGKVTMIEKTNNYFTIEDKSGYWVKVNYKGYIGYAFEGFLENNNSIQSNWNTFWAAFTNALKQKDKNGLLKLAFNEADFDGGAGFETPDMWATRMVSNSEWKSFVNDVNKGVVPDTYRHKGGKITNDHALYFEFKNNKWYWAGVLVD